MKKLLVLLILVLSACAQQGLPVTINADKGEVMVYASLAQTQQEREKGLMHVSNLPQNQGMLFLFPDDRVRHFWMKSTLIPLDMIFINYKKEIVHIVHRAEPEQGEPYTIYGSEGSVRYVLEVNGGFAENHGIQVGNTLAW